MDKSDSTLPSTQPSSDPPLVYRTDEAPLPGWLTVPDPPRPRKSDSAKALLIQQFESVFPRVMELISSGYSLPAALREVPFNIDPGAFNRWVKKNPARLADLLEAQELATDIWAGEMIRHATAEDTVEDVARSRLIIDTYKYLMGAYNRRRYGTTQSIEVNQTISITAALAQAQQRVIDVTPIEDVLMIENRTEGDD